jgi:hypothetical protein
MGIFGVVGLILFLHGLYLAILDFTKLIAVGLLSFLFLIWFIIYEFGKDLITSSLISGVFYLLGAGVCFKIASSMKQGKRYVIHRENE